MHRLRAFVAALFCISAGLFALYIAISGERIAGGVPLIPDAWNQMLGRVIFAAGGVFTLFIAALAFRDMRAPGSDADSPSKQAQAD
jgi:hypothetical protein